MHEKLVVFATIKKQFSKDFIKRKKWFLARDLETQNYFQTRAGTHPSSVTLKFNFCICGLKGDCLKKILIFGNAYLTNRVFCICAKVQKKIYVGMFVRSTLQLSLYCTWKCLILLEHLSFKCNVTGSRYALLAYVRKLPSRAHINLLHKWFFGLIQSKENIYNFIHRGPV